ncbi:MAG TPA: AI-2E family transporter [Gemmatimonadaceae bacterium]|nr:AI-2E family transporter [Gemmatimonadaceae bacterium]
MSGEGAARRFKFAPILTATVFTVLLLWIAGKVAHVILLLFLGIMISLYLGALSGVLQRRLRIPSGWSLLAAVMLTLGALAVLFYILVPPLVLQTQELVRVLPRYITGWEAAVDRLVARVPALASVYEPGQHKLLLALYDQVTSQFNDVVPKVFGIVEVLISIFSVGVMGLYLALHPALYREWLIALFPPIHRDLVRDVLTDCADSLRAYIVGLLLAMTFLASLTAIGLGVLKVPYALTFGVFTGLAVVVPFFGTLLATALPVLFVIGGPDGGTRALWVIVVGIVVHLIEGNVVAPLIMSKKVDLPPVLTIVFVLIIGKLLGPLGLLVAVPGLAVIMVIVRRILLTRLYEGQGFRRTTRERPLVLRLPASEGGVILPRTHLDIVSLLERRSTAAPV